MKQNVRSMPKVCYFCPTENYVLGTKFTDELMLTHTTLDGVNPMQTQNVQHAQNSEGFHFPNEFVTLKLNMDKLIHALEIRADPYGNGWEKPNLRLESYISCPLSNLKLH